MFCAVAVVGSLFSFPVFGSKCSPVQHMVNILCSVLLGPWYSVGAAFGAAVGCRIVRSVASGKGLTGFSFYSFGVALFTFILYLIV